MVEVMRNCPKTGGPEGLTLKKKYAFSIISTNLRRNDEKLALAVTTVLSCRHNL